MPSLVTTLPLSRGAVGWGILAGMFVRNGLAVPVTARWAERTRAAAVVVTA